MKKRFGFISLFAITALLLAAVGALTALAAPSGAVGTAKWNRTFTNLNQTLTLTVTDSDENKPDIQNAETAGLGGTPAYNAPGVGTPGTFFPAKAPIADWKTITQLQLDAIVTAIVASGDNYAAVTEATVLAAAGAADLAALNARDNGALELDDVVVVAEPTQGATLAVVSIGSNTVTIANSGTAAGAFVLVYFGSILDTLTVKVTSLSDQDGFTLTLLETGKNSGVFERKITMNNTATAVVGNALTDTSTNVPSEISLKSDDNDIAKFVYTDVSEDNAKRTASTNVELTAPAITELTLPNKTHTKSNTAKEVVLTAETTDAQAGVKGSTIKFFICEQSADCSPTGVFNEVKDSDDVVDDNATTGFGFNTNKYTRTDITGGKKATVKVELVDGDGTYSWYVSAQDNAGNIGESKADADLPVSGAANPNTIILDQGALTLGTDGDSGTASAVTGQWWDPTKTGAARLISDPAKAKNTSIRVVFDGDLDGDSVDSTGMDFKVNGAVPQEALFFSGKPNSVFLTVPAMDPSATPKVEVVLNGVSDKATNSNNLALSEAAAKDGVAPKFNVTLTGDLASVPISKTSVMVNITTDETLLGSPVVKVAMVAKAEESVTPDHFDLDATGALTAIKFATSYTPGTGVAAGNNAGDNAMAQPNTGVKLEGTDAWSKTFITSEFLPAGGGSRYVITIEGSDSAGNLGKQGTSDPTSSSALLFELDKSLPTPTITPTGDVFRTDPFITINWTAEGSGAEYDGDSHVKVTLTTLTLDGTDMLPSAATTDNRTFILATSGLALGEHTVNVNGTDEVGNKLTADSSAKFTVKEVAKISIPLKPGQNLISLPGEPGDPAINSVITVTDVRSVISYDPVNPDPVTGSPWLTATRATASDPLTGSLTSMDATHGYWVKTSSFDPIKVEIPDQGFNVLPPSIQVVGGWNLVPVVSIEGDAPGTIIPADTYFGSTKWVTAYTFDPETNAWTKILPKKFQNVVVGSGYWLYVTEDGILVP